MPMFPSDTWIKVFMEALNNNPAYADVAKNWEGDMCFQIEVPGAPEPTRLYLDLWHGKCRAAYQIADPQHKPAAFKLSAPLENFARVLRGELDPIQAMVTGKLKVEGNMLVIMKNIPTVLEFVRTARQVATELPPGA